MINNICPNCGDIKCLNNTTICHNSAYVNEIEQLKKCLFQMQNAAMSLTAKLKLAIEQRDRMVYNRLTEEERKLFFADKICESMDKEIEAL